MANTKPQVNLKQLFEGIDALILADSGISTNDRAQLIRELSYRVTDLEDGLDKRKEYIMTEVTKPGEEKPKQEYTGSSVSYYKIRIAYPLHFTPYLCECGDIIRTLKMDFAEGESFKAIWRKAAARLGKTKAGHNSIYDGEKAHYYGRLIEEEVKIPEHDVFDLG